MTTLELPQFSNSCGKVFADKIILASANKESEVPLKDIKKASFTSRPHNKSLFFIALPAMLFVFPFFSGEEDTFINIVFIALGILLMVVSITQANRKHTLNVKLASGSTIGINVWEGNLKDAKKFTSMVNSKLTKTA